MKKFSVTVVVAIVFGLVVGTLCGQALAGSSKLLTGFSNYDWRTGWAGDPQPSADSGDQAQARVDLDPAQTIIYGANPLDAVPEYVWWYGCSPTSGGMMVEPDLCNARTDCPDVPPAPELRDRDSLH